MTERGPEIWTPEQRGRALHMIYVIANAPVSEWRTKEELHATLYEFRDSDGEDASSKEGR